MHKNGPRCLGSVDDQKMPVLVALGLLRQRRFIMGGPGQRCSLKCARRGIRMASSRHLSP